MIEEEEYFRVIEEHFLQKRGNPMLLNPKEWSLIHEWYDQSIPEEVVLRAIDRAFERKVEDRLPLSLRYASRLVKSELRKYVKSLEGKDPTKEPEAKNVGEYLKRLAENLEKSCLLAQKSGNRMLSEYLEKTHQRLSEEIVEPFLKDTSTNLQRVEHQLTTFEKEIEQVLLQMISEEQMNLFKEDAMRELKSFESKLDLAVYQEMLRRALIKAVRRVYQIPRLSLFYM